MRSFILQINLYLILITQSAASQIISYILPDIGTPGMNTYIEIIGPSYEMNNFGNDGLFLNNSNDQVKIIYDRAADTNKVTFGPLVVSWNGRMISTQVFVHPDVMPNSDDWRQLSNQFIISFRVSINGNLSNSVKFYILQPQHIGDISSDSRTIFHNEIGIRSPRGAMIVDSIIFGNNEYKVDVNRIITDTDPFNDGNQGYFPLIILSKGRIAGGTNTRINVSGSLRHAGPGGGGGGGRFCDRLAGSMNGDDGGNGFTGGGPGGYNDVLWGGGGFKNNGTGTWSYGKSMNYVNEPVRGGYESSGGGTGHPFGKSGEGCSDGNNCDHFGMFGGGSGYQQNKPGGSGGYATLGSSSSVRNGGKANGNVMVVPLAGGSGGASGNPEAANECSGSGGGGGGAIQLFGTEIKNIHLYSVGGSGGSGIYGSDGGGGSGGFIGISTKLGSSFISMTVDGGSGGGQRKGGSGRTRYDSPVMNNLTITTADASNYRGITSDTTQWVYRTGQIKGTAPENTTIHFFLKPDNGQWRMVDSRDMQYSDVWQYNFNLTGYDSLYFFVAMLDVELPLTGEYDAEPKYVMSQAAANILRIFMYPIIASDTIRNKNACADNTLYDTVYIKNVGSSDLILDLDRAVFSGLMPGFQLVDPIFRKIIPPRDSIPIIIKYTHQTGQTGLVYDYLEIPHNDIRSQNPWRIKFEVNISEIEFEFEDLYFGKICYGTEVTKILKVINKSSNAVTFKNPVLARKDSSYFEAKIIGSNYIITGDTAFIQVTFKSNERIATYVTAVILRIKECDSEFLINVIVENVSADLEIPDNNIFSDTKIGSPSTIQFRLQNKGLTSTFIESLPVVSPPFSIVGSVPSIPPPRFLSPDEEIIITLQFDPQKEGLDTACLKFEGIAKDTACADSITFCVYGNGVKSNLFYKPTNAFFGVKDLCDTAISIRVYIENKGATPIPFNYKAQIVGPDASSFRVISDPAPFTLQPGDSVNYLVEFIPSISTDGLKTATFQLKTDDKLTPVIEVKLEAEMEYLNVDANPAPINFGSVPIGIINNQSIILTNNGKIDRHIFNVVTTHSDLSVNPLSGNLFSSGGFASFDVSFRCSREGNINDTVKFIFDEPCHDTLTVVVLAEGLTGDANFSKLSLDFGKHVWCDEPSIDSIVLKNKGKVQIILSGIVIDGPDASLFTSSVSTIPDTLNPGDSTTFYFTFIPGAYPDGTKTARAIVYIFMNGATFEYFIELKSELVSPILIPQQMVDYGKVKVGLIGVKTINRINNSIADVGIESIAPFSQPLIFEMEPVTLPAKISIGNNIDFNIKFLPQAIQFYYDTLKLKLNFLGCSFDYNITIVGEGAAGDSIKLWLIPDTLVSPLIRNFRLPVFGKLTSSSNSFHFNNFIATINFDATLFYPESVSNGKIVENYVVNKRRFIKFKTDTITFYNEPAIINELIGATMLGENDSTSLSWVDYEFVPSSIISHTDTVAGLLRIEICRSGGERLLRNLEPMNIIAFPNPADENVTLNINTLEVGTHIVELINIHGKKEKILEWNVDHDSHRNFLYSMNTACYSGGSYLLILKSPNRVIYTNLFIVK